MFGEAGGNSFIVARRRESVPFVMLIVESAKLGVRVVIARTGKGSKTGGSYHVNYSFSLDK
jgi:hypothetical protein